MLLPYLATLTAFVAGIGLLQQQASLPALWPWLLAGLAGLLLRRVSRLRLIATLILAFCLGCSWANWRAQLRMADRLDAALEGSTVEVIGHIANLPQATRFGTRFLFKPDLIITPDIHLPGLIQVQWYGPADRVHAGEIWRLQLKPKRVHGQMNPGGFDLEGWFLQQGIGATATVKTGEKQNGMAMSAWLVRARAALRSRIQNSLPGKDYQGVIVALTVGDQNGIPPAQWQRFAATGVTHLISISGLHITLLAGLAAWAVNQLWRRVPYLVARIAAQRAALVSGVLTALVYCLLAGMAVPTQRTLLMLLVAALCLWRARQTASSAIWLTALAVVVAIDPFAVLSVGFWLSFLTVGALLWVSGNQAGIGLRWQGWISTQWAATLASAPILLAVFGQLPLLSPLANAVAIPLVSMLVTPLALAGLAFTPLLNLAELGFAATDWFLQWCTRAPKIAFTPPPFWTLAPAALGVLLWLLPRGIPGRMLAPVFLLPLFTIRPPLLPEGQFRATMLDVGQGLAVLVETRNQTLLFDTGALPNGERVVLPALRASGRQQIDTLLLSHHDNDHIGSAEQILAGGQVSRILHRLPDTAPLWAAATHIPRQACAAGQSWQSDGVRFEVLWPPADYTGKDDNSRSCVLRIDNGHASLLIPADIGLAEEALLTVAPTTVVIAPHHGSKTSSGNDLLTATQPAYAVFSAGYLNRYRHPHPSVVERYAAHGARLLRTDTAGALIFTASETLQVESWRARHPRYWHAIP